MYRVIISDASCLIALDEIGQLQILKALFEQIVITPEVQLEFGSQLPDWIVIQSTSYFEKKDQLKQVLDQGEASSIALALEDPAHTLLIIDEKKGRKVAIQNSLEIIGTLGVILMAKKKAIIPSVKELLVQLAAKKFRFSQAIIQKILEESGEQTSLNK